VLEKERKVFDVCGFKTAMSPDVLFTQFRRWVGRDGYWKVLSMLMRWLCWLEAEYVWDVTDEPKKGAAGLC